MLQLNVDVSILSSNLVKLKFSSSTIGNEMCLSCCEGVGVDPLDSNSCSLDSNISVLISSHVCSRKY